MREIDHARALHARRRSPLPAIAASGWSELHVTRSDCARGRARLLRRHAAEAPQLVCPTRGPTAQQNALLAVVERLRRHSDRMIEDASPTTSICAALAPSSLQPQLCWPILFYPSSIARGASRSRSRRPRRIEGFPASVARTTTVRVEMSYELDVWASSAVARWPSNDSCSRYYAKPSASPSRGLASAYFQAAAADARPRPRGYAPDPYRHGDLAADASTAASSADYLRQPNPELPPSEPTSRACCDDRALESAVATLTAARASRVHAVSRAAVVEPHCSPHLLPDCVRFMERRPDTVASRQLAASDCGSGCAHQLFPSLSLPAPGRNRRHSQPFTPSLPSVVGLGLLQPLLGLKAIASPSKRIAPRDSVTVSISRPFNASAKCRCAVQPMRVECRRGDARANN